MLQRRRGIALLAVAIVVFGFEPGLKNQARAAAADPLVAMFV